MTGYGLAVLGYRVETRKLNGRWQVAHTGTTAPHRFRPDRADLNEIARTILGNARYVCGLRLTDPMPAVRVHTWYGPDGPRGMAEAAADTAEQPAPSRHELLDWVARGALDADTPTWSKIIAIGKAVALDLIDEITDSDGRISYRLSQAGQRQLDALNEALLIAA